MISHILQILAKGCLAGLVRCSSTPQVLGSTPGGSEFQDEVKKIPSPAETPKHVEIGLGSSRPALTRVTVWIMTLLCKGGASYINARWAACPSQVEFFISFKFLLN